MSLSIQLENKIIKARACEPLNHLERTLAAGIGIEPPITHHFSRGTNGLPNLYGREIFLPAGSIATSKIHLTDHQFVVMQGRAMVWQEEKGWFEVSAGHVGQTSAGNRRAVSVIEDLIWITWHATFQERIRDIEEELFASCETPFQRVKIVIEKPSLMGQLT